MLRYRAWRLASLTLAEKQAKELRRSGQSRINQACRQRLRLKPLRSVQLQRRIKSETALTSASQLSFRSAMHRLMHA